MKIIFSSVAFLCVTLFAIINPSDAVAQTLPSNSSVTSNIDLGALYRKISSGNVQSVGSKTALGKIYATSASAYSTLDVLNGYLKEKLTSLELDYILANPTHFSWRITYGDRRGRNSSLIFRVQTYEFSSSPQISNYILPEAYPAQPYRHRLTFNGLTLIVTDQHSGTNKYGSIRGLVVQAKPRRVVFESNGGTAVSSQNIVPTEKANWVGSVRTGYTFAGWVTDTNKADTFNFATPITANINLFAKWTINTYAVVFYTLRGLPASIPTQNVNVNTKLLRPANPTRSGCTFAGWVKDTTKTDTFNFANTPITASTSLYARWTVPVSFNTLRGTPATIASQVVTVNTKATRPANPTRSGCTFAGWVKDTTKTDTFNFATSVTAGTILNARWTVPVSFNTLKGTPATIATQVVTVNAKATRPANPTRSGCTFAGWVKDTTKTDTFNFATSVTAGTILYARWTVSVSFNTLRGIPATIATQVITVNAKATSPASPTRTGYIFAGWVKDTTKTDTFSFATTSMIAHITFYARWNPIVTFNNAAVNSPITSVSVPPNTAVSRPADPTRTGYIFLGWVIDTANTDTFNFATLVTQPMTLYAKWTRARYLIRFFAKGKVIDSQRIFYQEKAKFFTPNLSNGVDVFAGWYEDTSLTRQYDFNTLITTHKNLYAKWTKYYLARFMSDLGTNVSDQFITQGDKVQEPAPPTRDGYNFAGWYTNAQYTTPYVFNTTVTRDLTLYAKWNKLNYQVSFDMDGGTPSVPVQRVDGGNRASNPPTPTKAGYTFLGWYKQVIRVSELQGNQAQSELYNFDWSVHENITLKARWQVASSNVVTTGRVGETKIGRVVVQLNPDVSGYLENGGIKRQLVSSNTGEASTGADDVIQGLYRITFQTNGGNSIASQQVEYKGKIKLSSEPQREGYKFVGWYADQALTRLLNVESLSVAKNYTLYAKWNPTVTFNTNGGSVISSVSVNPNSAVSQPTSPTRVGYEFGGWYSDNGLSQSYNFANAVSQPLTLYAKWMPIVTFNANGGNFSTRAGGSSIFYTPVNINTSVAQPTNPTRTGYTFVGWYSDAGLSTPYVFSSLVTQPITLYARWNYIYHDITFDPRGGSCFVGRINEIPPNSYLRQKGYSLIIANRSGYIFGGWYQDTMNWTGYFDVDSSVNRTMTVYAKWNSIVIHFNTNGGSTISSISANPNTVVSRPADPTRSGYTFAGWYSDANLNKTFNFNTFISVAITLYAKWDPVYYTVTFYSDGALYSIQRVMHGSTTSTLYPYKLRHEFLGWYLDEWSDFNFNTPITRDITLHAWWRYITSPGRYPDGILNSRDEFMPY